MLEINNPPLQTVVSDVTGIISRPWGDFFRQLYGIASTYMATVANILGPYGAASNGAVDYAGAVDTRPGDWGTAEAGSSPITFKNVPSGYRVRILRVQGTLIAFPKVVTPGTPFDVGTYSGYSWGLLTTAPGGSSRATFQADDCLVWLQGAVGCYDPSEIYFDIDCSANGLLEADNIVNSQYAIFLNTFPSGNPIHIEATWTWQYQFEPAP